MAQRKRKSASEAEEKDETIQGARKLAGIYTETKLLSETEIRTGQTTYDFQVLGVKRHLN